MARSALVPQLRGICAVPSLRHGGLSPTWSCGKDIVSDSMSKPSQVGPKMVHFLPGPASAESVKGSQR